MTKQKKVKRLPFKVFFTVLVISMYACSGNADRGFEQVEIFPLTVDHAHGSTIVELPNGDLLAAWFQGSGERWADDVRIMGARLTRENTSWSKPFVMADVLDFPDINPVLFLDKKREQPSYGVSQLRYAWQ